MVDSNLQFNLSRGNPFNGPCGLSIDQKMFGKSIGGKIFTTENLLNGQILNAALKLNTFDVFDPIVPSDIIKNQLNYRAIFISNTSNIDIALNNIVCSLDDVNNGVFFSDIDIAIEGLYTIGEASRDIPTKSNYPANPSIYLDDEYDSTNKLNVLTFKKTISAPELPLELPSNCCLKMWIRRKNIMSKLEMPDGEFVETFNISVTEENLDVTNLKINYYKNDGRLSLSNWYEYSITTGIGSKITLKELFPKELNLDDFYIINTFVKLDKILMYYYIINSDLTKSYFLLIVKPDDISNLNKYLQINLEINPGISSSESINSIDLSNIFKSFYSEDNYCIFWKEQIKDNSIQSIGSTTVYDRIRVSVLDTNVLVSDTIFEKIVSGYSNRKFLNKELIDTKIIREHNNLINVEQFDDLFILFSIYTKNYEISNLANLNKSQLLYVFEKDIIGKNNKFNSYIGDGAQVLSHRLYPPSLDTDKRLTCFNVVKNSSNTLIFSNPEQILLDTTSDRELKSLLDGTRYLDFRSATTKEFKVQNSFITYELPESITNINNLLFTTSISIDNDENIYSHKNQIYSTNITINNQIGDFFYDRPWFQRNIINDAQIGSLSVPLEWADRTYKDAWISIVSSLQSIKTNIDVQYNFFRNQWKISYYDNNVYKETIFNIKDKQYYDVSSNGTTGTSGVPTAGTSGTSGIATSGTSGIIYPDGIQYTNLGILDIPYIFEPGTYQPISIKVFVKPFDSSNYLVNYKVYFKGNTTPIFNITLKCNDISNIGYFQVNPNKKFNFTINYLDILNVNTIAELYYIKNMHKTFLNNISMVLGPELQTNKQMYQKQANFKYYREINIDGIETQFNEINKSIILPVIIFGHGYKSNDTSLYYELLSIPEYSAMTQDQYNKLKLKKNYKYVIDNPFDFSTINIDDKNIRFYFDTDLKNPLKFKIDSYNYEKDYVVMWIKVDDFNISNKHLLMFYSDISNTDSRTEYITLKNNLYSQDSYFGSWQFMKLFYDEFLTENTGKIFNVGEPIIYQKTKNSELHLTKIDKEYMYGIAKIYKSHKFNMELEIPAEESLFFDESVKTDFINFIKQTANILKPSYTDINSIKQYGFDVLEAGETIGGQMAQTTNKRVAGLIAITPNSNISTYYDRLDDGRFNLLSSFNGFSKSTDWVIANPTNTKLFKSGTIKISGKLKSETVKFDTPFKDSNYYVFLSNPSNQKVYWQLICNNKFTITSSYFLDKEVSWMAFHKDIFGGVYTPNSIFVGKRVISGFIETTLGESPTTPNLGYWYNNEMLIKPEINFDGDSGSINISPTTPGYSLLLSCDQNINIYWADKGINQFRIKTSSPADCTVHWVIVKNGVEWWNELN